MSRHNVFLFIPDTEAPNLQFYGGVPGATTSKKQNFRWNATEKANYFCSIDSETEFKPCSTYLATKGSWKSKELADGHHTFRVKGVDDVGNEGPVLEHSWTIGMFILIGMRFFQRIVALLLGKQIKNVLQLLYKNTCMVRGDYCAAYSCFNDRVHSMFVLVIHRGIP